MMWITILIPNPDVDFDLIGSKQLLQRELTKCSAYKHATGNSSKP